MKFITIQNGSYTLNVQQISEIEWLENEATVTMVTGNSYTFEGEDLAKLIQLIK